MNAPVALSIRTFLGAKDFARSRSFYRALGFTEVAIDPKMSLFKVNEQLAFYLQDHYVKDWVNNSMVFLEVADLDGWYAELTSRDLPANFPGVRLTGIQTLDWGRECFLHDPAGVLWHFGTFNA